MSRQSDQSLQNKQIKEHSHNVISSLQSKLANTSDTFKSVLKVSTFHSLSSLLRDLTTFENNFPSKVRSDNLKLQKERKDQYSYTRQDSSVSATSATADSPLYHPERRVTRDANQTNGPALATQSAASPLYASHSFSSQGQGHQQGSHGGDAVIDFGGSFVQQQLQEPNQNSAYLEARDQTIESIESTIAELGQVYTRCVCFCRLAWSAPSGSQTHNHMTRINPPLSCRFASVLAEQREMVQRIDDNVVDVEMNVEGAHGQLLKYYQGISNNRGLMVRSFAVVVVFFGILTVLT